MSNEFLLGKDAGLYWGAAGAAIGAMAELTNAKDVTISTEAGEADVTTRANQGWRATAATLRELTIEFEMLWKPGDAAFDAMLAAFLSSGQIELAVLDQKKTVTGAQGPKGRFSITNFSRSEPLEEAITVSVTMKLAVYEQWLTI